MFLRCSLLLSVLFVGVACSGSDDPDGGTGQDVTVSLDASVGDAAGRDVFLPPFDAGVLVPHDAGEPMTCTETCDCPQGQACLNGVCGTAGVGAVYCCAKPGCPSGAACLGVQDRPARCPQAPDAGPDAGPRDSGQGFVGSECDFDSDCDLSQGITCWTQGEPPFLWGGYCTVRDCFPMCPLGSECIGFGGANPVNGCMQSCTNDSHCRLDAYCLSIPMSTIQICFPDCRDDIFDCAPRDGTMYCSRSSGRCEPTPMQSATAEVGDFCEDNRDCGQGEVCMGAFAWGISSGVCTQLCAGLPESMPCGPNETCQDFAGVGLCFRNCDPGLTCTNRPDAICDRLDPNWPTPSCVPL